MMRPEVHKATGMLYCARVRHIKESDARLLGADIAAVAAEIAGETGDPAFYIADGARELERRIGGLDRLEGYLKCLRAGAAK